MINVCILSGRLTADPELRMTESGVPVLNVSIANQRDYKPANSDEYPVDFMNLVAWRKTAEFIAGHFTKGSMITVIGRAETRKFTDKEGNRRTVTEFIVDRAYFGESKKGDRSSGVGEDSGDGRVPDFAAAETSFGDDDGFPPLEL